MLASKEKSRYNAYMKKTDNGFIVKTTDSETGVESFIKFTTDSSLKPSEKVENNSSKHVFRPTLKNISEDNPCEDKQNCLPLKKNPNINTKMSILRPQLRELQQKIPGFYFYEDTGSTVDFQNPKIVFVLNSKLTHDVNLNIPGKLMNVYYRGVLNEKGIIKFKAKSVIKPLTIVLGDHVININICHNLASSKETYGLSKSGQQKDDASLSHCSKESSKPLNKEKCTEIREPHLMCKTNDNNSREYQTDNVTENISNSFHGRLNGTTKNVTLTSTHSNFDNNTGEKKVSLIPGGLKSTISTQQNGIQTYNISPRSSDESTLKENDCKELRIKIPQSVMCGVSSNNDISLNKLNSPSNQSSEHNLKTYDMYPDSSSSDKPWSVQFSESQRTLKHNPLFTSDCMLSVPKKDTFSDNNNDSKTTCMSAHCIGNEVKMNDVSVDKSSVCMSSSEFEDELTYNIKESECRTVNSRCNSNISFEQIKMKLNEATASLHDLCSVIESIENIQEKSVSRETVGINELMTESGRLNTSVHKNKTTPAGSNGFDLNMSTNDSSSSIEKPYNQSNVECPHNENIADKSGAIIKETNKLCNKKDTSEGCKYERKIQLKSENNLNKVVNEGCLVSNKIKDDLPCKCTTNIMQSKGLKEPLSGHKFSELNLTLQSVSKGKFKKCSSAIQGTNRNIYFNDKRKIQSLTNLSDSNTFYVHKKNATPDSRSMKSQGIKLTQNVLARTKSKYQIKLTKNNLHCSENDLFCAENDLLCAESVSSCESECSCRTNRTFTKVNNTMGLPYPDLNENDSATSVRIYQEFHDKINSEQDCHVSDPKINSCSIKSLKTLYIKSNCTSSNNLSLSLQHSLVKMFKNCKDHNEVKTYDVYLPKAKTTSEMGLKNTNKSLGKKIKQKLSKWKNDLKNCGVARNSNTVQIVSNTIIHEENENNLIYALTKTESIRNLKDSGNVEYNTHQQRVYDSVIVQGSSNKNVDTKHKTLPPQCRSDADHLVVCDSSD